MRWVAAFALVSTLSYADGTSVSPYIDALKQKIGPGDTPSANGQPDPYIQSLKGKLKPQSGEGAESYIDRLKAEHPEEFAPKSSTGFTDQQKSSLGADQMHGAIQAVNEHHSDLELKRPGESTGIFGFKFGTVESHNFTGTSQYVSQPFESCYGNGYAPDITLYAGKKLLVTPYTGELSLIGTASVSYFHGFGTYQIQLYDGNGVPFPHQDRLTQLTFISVPVSLGLKYDFNIGRYIQPYGQIAPTLIGMSESRSDPNPGHKVLSKGITLNAGVSFLLDWIVKSNSWDLYQEFSIKHLYFTAEYVKLTSISSPVDAEFSGATAGFSFEF